MDQISQNLEQKWQENPIINHQLENLFMKHYAPNHMLAPKKGSSQKGVQLKPLKS